MTGYNVRQEAISSGKSKKKCWISKVTSFMFPLGAYSQIKLKTPVLVQSPKLNKVEPGQYLDKGPLQHKVYCKQPNKILYIFRL